MLAIRYLRSKMLHLLFCALVISLVLPTTTLALDAKPDSLTDASHFEFIGAEAWNYNFESLESGFVLQLKALSPAAEKTLTEFRDDRIQSIEILRVSGDFPVHVKFTLADSSLEAFDYLTDQPKRLVVDIFSSASTPAVASAASARAPAGELPIKVDPAPQPPVAARESTAGEPSPLTPTEALGLFDAADPGYVRFKVDPKDIDPKAVVTERRRLFLEFPVWARPYALLEDLLKEKPVYKIHEAQGQENLEARFLLQLFLREHPAATIKAGEIFLRKYPRSEYRQIIEHVLADTYFQHWLSNGNKSAFERSMGLYKDLVRKYPGSPLQERTELVMGLGYLKRGDAPSASRVLEKFKQNFPSSSFLPKVDLALAHADLDLASYDKALDRLKNLAESDASKDIKEEAAHLMGNVAFRQGKWADSIKAYNAAKEAYPEGAKSLGYATFNLGEAYFWNEEYLKSLDAFREYATHFPDTGHTAYALTRIGEIFEILGQPEDRSLAVYRESHFRFRDTDGGRLARVRFISRTMKEMSDKDIAAALEEISQISEKVSHPDFDDFIELVKADGYSLRGNYNKAAEMLSAHLAKNPRTEQRKKYEEGIASNLALQMRKELEAGNPIESLRIYGKNSELWFKRAGRLDPLYLASWAYEKAGAPERALHLYKEFEAQLNEIPKGVAKEEKAVIENLPSKQTLWLRMAAANCALNNYTECGSLLKKIGDPEKLKDQEYVELALLAATLMENSGKTRAVAQILDSVESRKEALKHPPTLLQLARAYAKIKQHDKASDYYDSYLNLAMDTAEAKQIVVVHGELADLYLASEQKGKARETLEKVIAAYGASYDLSPERYNLGVLYLEDGNQQAAQQAWQPLLGLQNNFWSKLAEDKIQDLKWKEDYGGVLNRLPASRASN